MAYKNEDYSIEELCSKYGISDLSLYDWAEKYEKHGLHGLEDSGTGSYDRYQEKLNDHSRIESRAIVA